ncbi:MAG: hypothetical protein GY822_19760 [Deltaproteobacteria bacterium]|nr:hypothetical protein [Deltaproteobacteria bacterium]
MPDGDDRLDHSARIETRPRQNGGWMVGPWWDSIHIIFAPAWWLCIGLLVVNLGYSDWTFELSGKNVFFWPTFALTFTMAHVFSVVFRSHLNRDVFRRFKARFVVVPLTLLAAFTASQTLFIFGMIFAVWFDNYHSSMQTFGYGRIYDMRAGNPALVGRRMDMTMALLAYLGPILAGATFVDCWQDWPRFTEVGLDGLVHFPGWALQHQLYISVPIIGGGSLFAIYYVYFYWRLSQRGYKVSKQKVATWTVLVVVSLYTFGFNSFGVSFLVMESFHSWQYFATVWWSEKKELKRTFHLEKVASGTLLTFILLVGTSFAFGAWTSMFGTYHFEFSLFLVVELMHYWYDGFIWSVRKKDVS